MRSRVRVMAGGSGRNYLLKHLLPPRGLLTLGQNHSPPPHTPDHFCRPSSLTLVSCIFQFAAEEVSLAVHPSEHCLLGPGGTRVSGKTGTQHTRICPPGGESTRQTTILYHQSSGCWAPVHGTTLTTHSRRDLHVVVAVLLSILGLWSTPHHSLRARSPRRNLPSPSLNPPASNIKTITRSPLLLPRLDRSGLPLLCSQHSSRSRRHLASPGH